MDLEALGCYPGQPQLSQPLLCMKRKQFYLPFLGYFGVRRAMSRPVAIILLFLLVSLPGALGGERIRVLNPGQGGAHLEMWFRSDPLFEYLFVPSRDFGLGLKTMNKYIKQYFPRRAEDVASYDYILLNSPEVYFFTTQQLQWMYDAIRGGAGGMNGASVMSQIAQIHNAWEASILSDAFPNDAAAVIARGAGGTSPIDFFSVRVNRNFDDPVWSIYLDYGIENIVTRKSRFVVLKEGAEAIAYQVGNFPGDNVPFIAVWEYGEGKGRTMTTGDTMDANCFFSADCYSEQNEYVPDMFINLVYYSTKRSLITDVEVYHRVRSTFQDFRTRMEILLSLVDFAEKFGASTDSIQGEVQELEGMYGSARELYFEGDHQGTEDVMVGAFDFFRDVEEQARRMKDRAMVWVYAIEWLATTAVLMLSSFALWSLMVRRSLYQAVRTTRFDKSIEE